MDGDACQLAPTPRSRSRLARLLLPRPTTLPNSPTIFARSILRKAMSDSPAHKKAKLDQKTAAAWTKIVSDVLSHEKNKVTRLVLGTLRTRFLLPNSHAGQSRHEEHCPRDREGRTGELPLVITRRSRSVQIELLTIDVSSSPTRGTTFTASLCRTPRDPRPSSSSRLRMLACLRVRSF